MTMIKPKKLITLVLCICAVLCLCCTAFAATPGASFDTNYDGVIDAELTWTQLKQSSNGTLYGYNAAAVTDTSIGASAFNGCSKLVSIRIPETVTSIGSKAFYGCYGLTAEFSADAACDVYADGKTVLWPIGLRNFSAYKVEDSGLHPMYVSKVAVSPINSWTLVPANSSYSAKQFSLLIGGKSVSPSSKEVSFEKNSSPVENGGIPITLGLSFGTNKTEGKSSNIADITVSMTTGYRISAVPEQSGTLTYNGNSQSPTWLNYDTNKLTISGTTSGINVDNYTATFTPKTGCCWSDGTTTAKNITWKINKAAGSVTAPTAKSLTYNGSDQALVNAGSSTTGTIQYKLGSSGTYGTSIPQAKDAGTYTVYYKVVGDGNHNNVAESSVNVTIGQKEVTLTWGTVTWTYDGSAHSTTCTAGSLCGSDTCTVNLTGNSITDAGTTTVTASSLSNDNYKLPSTKTKTLTVNKANYDMSGITFSNATKTYNGSVQNLAISGTLPTGADGKKVTVSYSEGQKNVGSKTITATFATTSANYNVPDAKTATLTITQKEVTLTWGTVTWTYDGNAHSTTCTAGSLCGTDTCTVTLTGNSVGANVGTATVTASSLSNANYKLPSSVTVKLTIDYPEFTVNDSNRALVGYKGTTGENLVIPETIIGDGNYGTVAGRTYKVTCIGSYAFYGRTGLTSITIPDSVTSIGNSAFYYCTGLTSVTIPNGVTSIESYAFEDCTGLTSITVASGNTKYDSRNNCNAIIETASNTLVCGCKNTVIPNGVTSIEASAFRDCTGLTNITIPDSVTSIGSFAFQNCTGLTSITIPNGVTSIGNGAFFSCSGLTSITIPDSVTSIGSRAFYDCTGLKSVIIGNGVTSISESAFRSCYALTSITIPDSVTSIGSSAFYDCDKLTSATFMTTGWKAGSTTLSSSDLANKSTAATYLRSTYSSYTWTTIKYVWSKYNIALGNYIVDSNVSDKITVLGGPAANTAIINGWFYIYDDPIVMKNDSSRTQYVERFRNPGEIGTNISLSSYSGKYAVYQGSSQPVYIGPTSVLFNVNVGMTLRVEIRNAYNMTLDDNVHSLPGSTYYGQVTSTSSSAYPSNGEQGGYWYVKAW